MAHSLWPKVKLQIPPLRFGRDDKVEGGAAPRPSWRGMDGASAACLALHGCRSRHPRLHIPRVQEG
jgi:hypothetical protein